jgi:radical SAM superfamily enzyme YgiQ (UPF0313 family)
MLKKDLSAPLKQAYDIALIRVNYASHVVVTPQPGLGYLSSYLKANSYKPIIIDAFRDRLNNEDILKILQRENITVAGLNCLTAYYNEVAALSQYLKNNGIKVIIGGVHPTFLPYQTLVDSKADYVFCGEGEIALLSFLRNNASNTFPDGSFIKGVYSLENLKDASVSFERCETVENLDDIPYPDWEQMNPNSYPVAPYGAFVKYFPIGFIFSSRGCPYSCKFCANPNFYNKRVRFRSPENVVAEMKLLIEKYHVKEIQFLDDNLTLRREHAEKLCNLIIENNIKVAISCPNGVRADRLDEDLIKLMKKAGFYHCALGIESANKTILENIKKDESIETIKNAIKMLSRNGIVTQGFFIFGLPGETKETIKETIDFALKSGLERAQFSILMIYPGSDLWNDLKGKFTVDFSQENYNEPQWVPEGLTGKDLLEAQSYAFKKFFFRPKIFFKTIRYIKPTQIIYLLKRLFTYRLIGK